MSADGRYVVFALPFTNLATGDNNNVDDVYIRDTVAGTTRLASATAA
jgi:hypothetical protein